MRFERIFDLKNRLAGRLSLTLARLKKSLALSELIKEKYVFEICFSAIHAKNFLHFLKFFPTLESDDSIFYFSQILVRERTNMSSTSIFDLSPTEKLQLVEDLWDDLAATPEAIPIQDWQIQELARRKANLQSNPASGLSWEDVKQRIRSRYGR